MLIFDAKFKNQEVTVLRFSQIPSLKTPPTKIRLYFNTKENKEKSW